MAEFEAKMGKIMRDTLRRNLVKHREDPNLREQDSWVDLTCGCIGKEDARPPTVAIDKIKAILSRHTKH